MDILVEPYFAVFLITILGYLLGKVSFRGISFDVSGILFVAILFGYLGLKMPSDIKQIGLVLFVFTIGFQAGPSFFENFKTEGKSLLNMAIIIVFTGALLTFCLTKIFDLEKDVACGMYAGAITSTPGLAAVTDLTSSQSAVVGYGIAYPFGVIGIIILINILPRMLKMSVFEAEQKYKSTIETKFPKVINKNFMVVNSKTFGKTLEELHFREVTGATISRIFHDEELIIPNSGTKLEHGDLIKAVGTEEQMEKVRDLVGEYTALGVSLSKDYEVKYVIVTNKNIIGEKIQDLHLQHEYNIVFTRIRRSGIDFSASADIKIHFGDKIRIVGSKDDIEKVTKILGGNLKKTYETDYITIAVGIVLGILVGMISIPVTDNFNLSLGLSGGVMTVAIILSRVHKLGFAVFSVTTPALNIMRRIGLILFLASVGSDAGSNLVSILKNNGWEIIVSGILISVVPTIISVFFAKYLFKIDILQILGGVAGGRTSTPGLASATSMTNSNAPSVAYATVYPISVVLIMVCVQLLFAVL